MKGCFKIFQQGPFGSAAHSRNKPPRSESRCSHQPALPGGRLHEQEVELGEPSHPERALRGEMKRCPEPLGGIPCQRVQELQWLVYLRQRMFSEVQTSTSSKKIPICLKQRAIVKGKRRSLPSSVQLCIHTPPTPMMCQLGEDLFSVLLLTCRIH